MEIAKTIRAHRQVASFLDRHAELIESLSYDVMCEKFGGDTDEMPWVGLYSYCDGIDFTVHGSNQRETMRVLRRAIGGQWEKGGYGNTFRISRDYCDIRISIRGDRNEVCQRVVTGTHTEVIPAVEARPERIEQVEEVEWVCGNLLDDNGASDEDRELDALTNAEAAE